MPIVNRADADEVEQLIARVFGSTADQRSSVARRLFVEVMDFDASYGTVSLANAASGVALPQYAERVAELEGVHVVFVQLDTTETDKVRKADASEAARLVASQLGDDILLVFVNTSGSQLHFIHPSFVGSRPTLRRMVVERDLPRRTAVQQVSNIYWRHRDTGSVRVALEESFDVEPVTRRFFAEYQRVFDHAMDRVEGFGDGAEEQESKKLFVQTLFDRLMFVYFLQRKGWLVFRGRKDYLEAFWEDHCNRDDSDDFGAKNFHYDRLRLLFFGGLNNYGSQDVTSDPTARNYIGEVPFLNGGLFEETADEKNRKGMNGTKVPDECIEEIFDKLFGRFNFTVMESTPFDIEVAVDPEMLGKVFEELVTGRHESGSYYTPRAVVSFMCREALKGYLGERMPSLGSEVIASFVDDRETSGISLAAARGISSALDDFSVIDPACGSGAYLLGMMQELVDLHTALYSDRLKSDARDVYALKLHIIQRNLYGVDVDEFAVNIAMLRLWLSLAIEYDGDTPEPLPNLDFEIVRGDSLLGPDPSPDNYGDLFRNRVHSSASRLAELKSEYMDASTGKDEIKEQIEQVQFQLRAAIADSPAPEEAVDWRIEFAEVFARGGFDAVVANPPYVRQEKIGASKPALRRLYGGSLIARSDLYCYFYIRALQLLREGGTHVFVCSNSWLDVGYGAKLQQYLLSNAHAQTIYESAIERQFSTAQINTIISVIRKSKTGSDDATNFVSLRDEFEAALSDAGQRREMKKTRAELRAAGTDGRKFVGDKWGGKYLRAPDIYHHIMRAYADKLVRLGDEAEVKRGVTTGANAFFYLDAKKIARWGIEDRFLAPVMTSPKESRSLLVDPATLPNKLFMCHENKRVLEGTAALEYIQWGESQGFHLRPSVKARKPWYNLGVRKTARLAMNYMVNTTARTYLFLASVLCDTNFQMFWPICDPESQLCDSVNSEISQMGINVNGRGNFGGGLIKIQTYETKKLRIVDPSLLAGIDNSRLSSTDWDVLNPSPARRALDNAVFDAVGLTQGERDAVHEAVVELVENRLRKAKSV